MKKNLSKIISFLIIATLFFIAFFSLYFYLYSNIQEKKEKASVLYSELKSEKDRNSELDSINSNLKATLESYNRIKSLFIEDANVVDFIQSIENMAKQNNLAISTNSISSGDSPDLIPLNKEFIFISISTSGSWIDTMRFLGMLENLQNKVSISSFSAENQKEEKGSKNFWKSSITFSVIKNKPQ